MTTAAVTARARAFRLGLTVSPDAVALAGIGALSAVLVALTWNTWGDLGSDTGYDLVAGARVAGGDLPYVDFNYYYGPLAPFLLGLVSWVGGGGLAPALGLGIALAGSIVLATYGLARTQTGPTGAFLAAALTAPVAFGPSNFSFVLPHTYAASLGLLAVLGVLLALVRYGRTGANAWLLAAGAGAGVVALTRPEFEIAVLLAAAVWLALRAGAGEDWLREGGLFAVPAILLPAVVYGAFLTAVRPGRLLLDNLYPVDELRAGGNEILRLHAPLTASSFLELGLKLTLYAAGAAVLVALGHALARPGLRRGAVIAVAGGVALVVATSAARPETLRYGLEFAYGWIPAGAVVGAVVLARRGLREPQKLTPALQAATAGAVVLAVLALKTYAAFFVHSTVPQLALYAVPLAAVFLVHLHLVELAALRRPAYALGALWLAFLASAGIGLTLKDARSESASVQGPGGTLSAAPKEARLYRAALSWIARETEAGEPILVAPQLTALYTLSGREDPLPQISLLPGALPSVEDEQAAIAGLEQAGVRLVVVDRRTFPEYGHTSFGGSFDRVLDAWIHKRFVLAAKLRSDGADARTLDIWLRRGS